MSKRSMFILTLVAFFCMLVASGALAGIGVYKVDGGLSVPATIKYMLNKDAQSLTVEICPAGPPLGTAVKTWSFAAGAPECAKGLHQNLVWNGEDNSSNPVPAGDYKVKVTATGAAVDGTSMVPIWEALNVDKANDGWRVYDITVNRDPNSPLYGNVYVTNYQNSGSPVRAKGIYEFAPDGSSFRQLPDPVGSWSTSTSGPWAVEFDADNHLYVSDRTTAVQKIYRYEYNAGTDTWTLLGSSGGANDRNMAIWGSGIDMKLIETFWLDGTSSTKGTRLYAASPEPPGALVLKNASTSPSPYTCTNDTFQGVAFSSDSNSIYIVGGRTFASTGTVVGGGLSKWDVSNLTVSDFPAQGRNASVQGTGLSITPDNNYMWVARMAGNATWGGTDTTSMFYKFPVSGWTTAGPADTATKKYGLATAYTGAAKRPVFCEADNVGNVVATGGAGSPDTQSYFFGLYEEPLNAATSAATVSVRTIHFSGEPSPVFISANAAPASIPADGTTNSIITVVGEDGDNTAIYDDIEFCRFHCPEMHYGTAGDLTSGVPMNRISRNGIQNTYQLGISAATDVPAGTYQATIALFDRHVNVLVGTGTVTITVTGGTISGRLTNAETDAPCANVTVMAKLGAYERTAVTDANGDYNINVSAGTGYTVQPFIGEDGVTHPHEYNLGSKYHINDPDINDWPKTVDVALGGTATATGRLWPLAVTQVTYDWTTSTARGDNRFVSVIGVVMRAAADSATSQKGFNGYYWIEDTRRAGTLQGLKVLVRAGDPVIKEGDKVVIDGMYMKQTNYVTGRMIPSVAPVVKSANNAIPAAREMTYANLISYLTGGLWHIGSTTVAEKDTVNIRFRVQIPKSSPTDTVLGDVWIDLDTDATTGITLPEVGTLVEITGIIDELSQWGTTRMLRPGKPSDVKSIVFVNSLGEAKALANQSSIIFDIPAGSPLIITSAAPYHPTLNLCEWVYVEDSNRVTGIKINGNGLLPANLTIWPGDTVTGRLAGVLQQTGGDYELKLNQAPTIVESVDNDTSLVPAPIAVSNLAFAGGWLGGCPAVFDRGYGTSNQGLFGKIYGRVTEIIYETDPYTSEQKPYIVFIDDGAAVKGGMSGNPPTEKTGIKCIVGKAVMKAPDGSEFPVWASQPGGLSIGDYVVATGIIGSEWIQAPVNRQRVLRMRYCYDPNSGPPPVEFYDQFQIIEDVP